MSETSALWAAVGGVSFLVGLHLLRHVWQWLRRPPVYPEFCRYCGSTMTWRQFRRGPDYDPVTGSRLPPNEEWLECSGDKKGARMILGCGTSYESKWKRAIR